MKYFYYLNEDDITKEIIRIEASSRPMKTGTFSVEQFSGDGWYFGPWREVSFKTLKTLEYIGSTTSKDAKNVKSVRKA